MSISERLQRAYKDYKTVTLVQLMIAGVLFPISSLLGLWIGTAGLMIGGLAGGFRLSDHIVRSMTKTNIKKFRDANVKFRVIKRICSQMNVHNHARAKRSMSRSTFSHASGGDSSDDGGSGSGDSDPASDSSALTFPFVFQILKFLKTDSFTSSWQFKNHDCCCLSRNLSVMEAAS